MKIAHLNTLSYGGAAVVARRLHLAALAAGVDSTFVTKFGLRRDPTPNYVPLQDATVRYYLRGRSANARWYRVGKLVQRLTEHPNLARRPEGLEIFSPLNRDERHYDCLDRLEPDVIHLHWVAGFVDHERFFQRNRSRKFVWTLHDMNPITGGCHHSDGCERYREGCRNCPQLAGTIDPSYSSQVFTAKARSLSTLRDDQLAIVSPSKWLLEKSTESRITRRFPHFLIENPAFDMPADGNERADLKCQLGLPADKKVVVFVADNLRNPRKGVATLFRAASLFDRAREVQFVGLGQRTDAPRGVAVTFVGRRDERELRRYYACADVVVNPSVAENSSLVIIEALSCGTPVIACAAGGTPELVKERDGVLVQPGDVAALARALGDVLFRRGFDSVEIARAAQRHSPRVVWEKYSQVYGELMA